MNFLKQVQKLVKDVLILIWFAYFKKMSLKYVHRQTTLGIPSWIPQRSKSIKRIKYATCECLSRPAMQAKLTCVSDSRSVTEECLASTRMQRPILLCCFSSSFTPFVLFQNGLKGQITSKMKRIEKFLPSWLKSRVDKERRIAKQEEIVYKFDTIVSLDS